MSTPPSKSPSSLLVVGGGIAALTSVANFRLLDSSVKIIVVEPKDYCETVWAAYRTPFDAKLAEQIKPCCHWSRGVKNTM